MRYHVIALIERKDIKKNICVFEMARKRRASDKKVNNKFILRLYWISCFNFVVERTVFS